MRISAETTASQARSRIGGGPLRNISGRLRSSIRTSLRGGTLDTYEWSTFSDVIYAPTHETGATITARRAYSGLPGGPYLNIPIGINKLDSGATAKQARAIFQEGGFIFRSRKGNWIVADKDGNPMFVLKKSVVIPPRLGLMNTAIDGFNAADQELPQLLIRMRNIPLE